MKKLNENQFTNCIKKNNIFLVISLVFLILAIVLVYFGYENQNKKLPELVSMNTLIANYSLDEDIYAYVDVNTKPYLFAVYENDGIEDINKFYLVMDENNFLYIIYMSLDKYNSLNVDSISNNPIRISGVTRKIENDIKELAISAYNELMEDEYLNDGNFKDYVGLIYLDTETKLNDSTIYYVVAFFSFLFFVVFISIYFSVYIKNMRVLKKYSQSEIEQINLEIFQQKSINPYKKMKFYLLKDYVVDTSNGIVILKYTDIIWAYPYEYRYNGLLVNKNIKVMTTDKKINNISNTKFLDKRKDETIQEILSKLKEKNSNILLGFNKENKKIVKEKDKN